MIDDTKKTQDKIIEECSQYKDWFDKYDYLIKQGKTLQPMDETLKTQENTISGCQSQVWLIAEMNDKNIHFLADSDSILIKGIISLLLRVLNNNSPETILLTELYFINKIGLNTHLSPSRANGLMSIIKQMKTFAHTLQLSQKNET